MDETETIARISKRKQLDQPKGESNVGNMKSKIMVLGLAAVLLFAVGCAGNKKSANLQSEIDRLNQEAQLKESELQKLNEQLAAVQAEVSRLQAEQG
ncbi:MAG: hypothetical protein PHS88_12560, partial [Candidatus Omnitrophica bacterium]|nr:hypothetical protein [Candidatus Omnitrophota bacterium]